MAGLAAPAEQVNVTAICIPVHTLLVEMFRETRSGLSVEMKDNAVLVLVDIERGLKLTYLGGIQLST